MRKRITIALAAAALAIGLTVATQTQHAAPPKTQQYSTYGALQSERLMYADEVRMHALYPDTK